MVAEIVALPPRRFHCFPLGGQLVFEEAVACLQGFAVNLVVQKKQQTEQHRVRGREAKE